MGLLSMTGPALDVRERDNATGKSHPTNAPMSLSWVLGGVLLFVFVIGGAYLFSFVLRRMLSTAAKRVQQPMSSVPQDAFQR